MVINLSLAEKEIKRKENQDQISDTDLSLEDLSMGGKIDPLNISLLILNNEILRKIGEVKSKDVYEQNSTTFKKDGLFSTDIFGAVGSKERLKRFGYINMGLEILHPRIYKELISLSSLYKGILEGKKYAVYDNKTKDFVETDKLEGETGYGFFFKYYDQIKFRTNTSTQRLFKILFIKKYKLEDVKISNYVVIPAGIRDYVVTESGKVLENEINNIYRKLLTVSNTAQQFKHETRDIEFINQIRVRLQKVVLEIYEYLENMLDGKSKFIQGKWTKRSVFYGTRNVITGTPESIKNLENPNEVSDATAVLGPLQAAKGLMPIAIFELRTKFLNNVFDIQSDKANLIDPKTLLRGPISINEKIRSQWVTDEGLEGIVNKFIQAELLMSDIIISDKYYLYLILDEGDTITIVNDGTTIPDEKKSLLRPMKYIELMYITLFDVVKKYKALLTRYPITGYGSTVIVELKLKATTRTREVKIKYNPADQGVIAPEYPLFKQGVSPFYSLTVPSIYLSGLSADFDGETIVV